MVSNETVAGLIKIYGGIEMSKMINIKGKEISENTIVEALKKHCGFIEDEPLKAGDVVKCIFGLRIIIKDEDGYLTSHTLNGKHQMGEGDFVGSGYKKIGTLDRIFMQAGINLA